MLEVQILALETRVPWGINNTSSGGGVFSASYPGVEADDPLLDIPPGTRHVIRTGMTAVRSPFPPDIQVPLAPFNWLAPAPVVGERRDGARRPELEAPGLLRRQHGRQGWQGPPSTSRSSIPERSSTQTRAPRVGTAIEQFAGVFRFIVHKGVTISGPRAETDTHYMIMGIDLDLDRATRHATWEVVDFLVKEKGLTPAGALARKHRWISG